ncbi:hypothetical protein ABKN59_011233 [Abortiporus biennis]
MVDGSRECTNSSRSFVSPRAAVYDICRMHDSFLLNSHSVISPCSSSIRLERDCFGLTIEVAKAVLRLTPFRIRLSEVAVSIQRTHLP